MLIKKVNLKETKESSFKRSKRVNVGDVLNKLNMKGLKKP